MWLHASEIFLLVTLTKAMLPIRHQHVADHGHLRPMVFTAQKDG
jgi:hypothetical protein